MQEPVLVAAVQLSSQDDLADNLRRTCALIDEAAARGARLVLLPENFAFFGDEAGKAAVAEDLDHADGPIGGALRERARARSIWVVAGGMPERSPDAARPYNTCAVFAPTGQVSDRYRKVHLFDVDIAHGGRYRESDSTTAGDGAHVAEAAGARVGLSVCYDLRFPELYRALVQRGAELLVVPAAFTLMTGKDHWHVLLRARAIESQCFVLAAAQWGKHPRNRQTYGKSCIVDPWGEVIAQASEGEGVITARLDPAYLEQVRTTLPSLTHRRM
ncbi:MAG: carbon-nitrogen hydrolase family protein [Polyangiaceae bacterium]